MSTSDYIAGSAAVAPTRRASDIKGLKILKAPAEGGTRKNYEDFIKNVRSHIMISWDGGNDLGYLMENMKEPELELPDELSESEKKSMLKVRLWELKVVKYSNREDLLMEGKKSLFALVMDGVSKIIRSKLLGMSEFKKSETDGDVVWLLESLEDIMMKFEHNKPNILALDDQNERIARLKQKENVGNDDFVKIVQKEISVYEKHGGLYLWGKEQQNEVSAMMTKVSAKHLESKGKPMTKELKSEHKLRLTNIVKEKIAAMTIIKRSCSVRYKTLQDDLLNAFLRGKDEYPDTVSDALHLLNNYKCEVPVSSSITSNNGGSSRSADVTFTQTSGSNIDVKYLKGTNGSFFPEAICKRCKMFGHYQSRCPVAVNDRGTRMNITQTTDSNNSQEVDSPSNGSQSSTSGEQQATQEVSQQYGVGLNQSNLVANINPNWILLDSESSQHLFKNRRLLRDVEAVTNGESLRLYTNGGYMDTNQKGKFGNFLVWFNAESLANILSLALVTEEYRVTMDSDVEDALIVHLSQQHRIKFKKDPRGLYYLDTTKLDLSKLTRAFNFLSTVKENKKMYGIRDIRKADEANALNRKVNHQAKDKYLRIIKDNWIRNVPFTVGDVRRSHDIYGPPIPPIKGRTRYQEAQRISDAHDIIQIPKQMYDNLKHVTLCVDFYFVNGVEVFHSISRKIGYRTVSFPINRTKSTMLSEINDIFKIYNSRGFKIIEVHADNEFEKISKDILPVRMRLVGTDEHVPEVERSIQTQKNDCRAMCHAMPFKCIPRVMIREMIAQSNTFLNAFGNSESSSMSLSPRNIIDNLPHIDYNDLKYEFGQYVQLHVLHTFTNNMKHRTIGAIVLGPNNIRGRYNFMSLETGSKVNGRVVSVLPLTDEVISRVEELGIQQHQPYRESKMLRYEWRPGLAFDADDYDLLTEKSNPEMIEPPVIYQHTTDTTTIREHIANQGADVGDDEQEFLITVNKDEEEECDIETISDEGKNIEGNVEGDLSNIEAAAAQGAAESIRVEAQGADIIKQNEVKGVSKASFEETEVGGVDQTSFEEIEVEDVSQASFEEHIEVDGQSTVSIEDKNEVMSGTILTDINEEYVDDDSVEERRNKERDRRETHLQVFRGDEYGRGKRIKKPNKAYSFLQTEFSDLSMGDKSKYFKEAWKEYRLTGKTNMLERYTTGMVFAQMSAQRGINKYKEKAERMLMAEFQQLLEYKTFHGVKATDLTFEQRKKAGNMINLIEEKINRGHTHENPVLKGRSCFNGKVQRGLYSKEETSSPTVSQDAFFLTCLIDAIEGRSKAITDVKGAYLNAKMNDVVIMKIIGREVELFCKLDPSLRKFVTTEKKKKVLYTQLDKALYGCVQSALLWYELYSTTLKEMGFVINPYDLCVANATIKGKQCTICWYVDDNKISHCDSQVVDEVIKKIESKFGSMSKTVGDEHDFLGMNIKYKKKKVEISMKKHILKALDEFMEDVTRNAATPANSHLFSIREDSPVLDEERADNFHSVVALLLFISKRCRLDIQTAVAFLTTRVSKPNEDDWKKLRRVLQYLRGTIDLRLTLGADNILKAKTWVDVSYGVHNDCKSHTGGAMSWGWGVLLTKCQKQKLNTKSSTEGEIVGVSDYLPNVIWTRMFLKEQGYVLDENIVYQDNMSSMKIITNGKRSSGQKTKHMNNRYFWIKDRLSSEGIQVQYCPTEKMVADFFTKPLQGSLFRKFRDIIMGYKHISSLDVVDGDTLPEERVKKSENLPNGKIAKFDNGSAANMTNRIPNNQ